MAEATVALWACMLVFFLPLLFILIIHTRIHRLLPQIKYAHIQYTYITYTLVSMCHVFARQKHFEPLSFC